MGSANYLHACHTFFKYVRRRCIFARTHYLAATVGLSDSSYSVIRISSYSCPFLEKRNHWWYLFYSHRHCINSCYFLLKLQNESLSRIKPWYCCHGYFAIHRCRSAFRAKLFLSKKEQAVISNDCLFFFNIKISYFLFPLFLFDFCLFLLPDLSL